jgi:hypothetical protein
MPEYVEYVNSPHGWEPCESVKSSEGCLYPNWRRKMAKKKSNWKKGPLPPDTWMWGGVVKVGDNPSGFYFADFHGDYVTLCPGGEIIKADQVAMWNNCLDLPPTVTRRAGGHT